MKRTPLFILAFAAGLAVLGAGCGAANSPVSLDKYATPTAQTGLTTPPPSTPDDNTPPPDQAAQTPPTDVPVASSTTVAASSTSSTPTSTDMTSDANVPLAFPGVLPSAELANKYVHLKTTKGDITFELLPAAGPKAASNFYYLVQHKFYDGLTFHRVVPGFVIQGGDPLGTGTGGPGYAFADDPVNMPYNAGIVAMANSGPNTNGSQFFIMLADNPLPPSYSIFGKVTSGMDVVQKIAVGDVMTSVTIDGKK
ncbi:MAG: peptidylprolyl isomerase [Patescibacteria group bacterium]